jgi:4-hydroxy-3-methylbut-2-en-1-yl diphosphate reductase
MKVACASCMGFCPGVRRALDIVSRIDQPNHTTILGPLVHNPAVTANLLEHGFHIQPDADTSPPVTPLAVVTAHGISDRRRSELVAAGIALVDATCPLVRRIHDTAADFQREGFFVVVIGRQGHAEVRGITEDLARCAGIEFAAEARSFDASRIAVICQSTTPTSTAIDAWHAVQRHNPDAEVVFADTICAPTRERLAAVVRLAARVDGMVVVGGRNSNNSRQLAVLAESLGTPTLMVESADEIHPASVAGWETAGLTAGTSTPQHLIDEVKRALEAIDTGVSARRSGGQAA